MASEDVKLRVRKSGIYASDGEETFCENGHYLGTMAQDVSVGDVAEPKHFKKLAPGVVVGVTVSCPECSGAVTDGSGNYWFKV